MAILCADSRVLLHGVCFDLFRFYLSKRHLNRKEFNKSVPLFIKTFWNCNVSSRLNVVKLPLLYMSCPGVWSWIRSTAMAKLKKSRFPFKMSAEWKEKKNNKRPEIAQKNEALNRVWAWFRGSLSFLFPAGNLSLALEARSGNENYLNIIWNPIILDSPRL